MSFSITWSMLKLAARAAKSRPILPQESGPRPTVMAVQGSTHWNVMPRASSAAHKRQHLEQCNYL
jgi:hypothetical protein